MQRVHRISTGVNLGWRDVADSLTMKARAALATHMAVIYLCHVLLLLPQTGGDDACPAVISTAKHKLISNPLVYRYILNPTTPLVLQYAR